MRIEDMNREPKFTFKPDMAKKVLEIGKTYLDVADHLIYSYGSKTFLSGYDLYDQEHDGKGNIDCSTFLLLVLAGISYQESPYAKGHVDEILPKPFTDINLGCFDNLPERYIPIAERIGRPYLAGPKGLDLDKAAHMGISNETLMEEIRASGVSRKSVEIAKHFIMQGACFRDSALVKPGDIVFFQSKNFFKESRYKPENGSEVTHVGIIWEDTSKMINSSGYFNKERALAENLPAVSVDPIYGKRIPVYFARPDYRG